MKILIALLILSFSFYHWLGAQTSNTVIDTRDSNIYKTIQIGDQLWFAENLKYYNALKDNRVYANDKSNYYKYGLLYIWFGADSLCPTGWHLPSLEEWNQLFAKYDCNLVDLKKMAKASKEVRKLILSSHVDGGETGLDVLYAGCHMPGKSSGTNVSTADLFSGNFDYYYEGSEACFWTSTKKNFINAYIVKYDHSDPRKVFGTSFSKGYRCSIRCVKD